MLVAQRVVSKCEDSDHLWLNGTMIWHQQHPGIGFGLGKGQARLNAQAAAIRFRQRNNSVNMKQIA